MLWIREVFPDPGAPYCNQEMMSVMTRSFCSDGDTTYEKVSPSERDSALRVPFFTVQEIEGVL